MEGELCFFSTQVSGERKGASVLIRGHVPGEAGSKIQTVYLIPWNGFFLFCFLFVFNRLLYWGHVW